MSSDALSEVLRAVRLRGAIFFDVRATAPWVATTPPARELAPMVMPGAEHVIEYHAVITGECYGSVKGEAPVKLFAGDIVVFPQGDAHILTSDPKKKGTEISDASRPLGGMLPVVIAEGGGGALTHVVCGFLGCDARPFNPLLSALPKMIIIRNGEALTPFVKLAVTESSARRAGGEAVLARLSELMFVEMVRHHLATLPADQIGWLAGLRDEYVGKSLALLHDRPKHDWSLEELASEVGLSRSAFAERFTRYMGTAPMQYLAQWRMQLAAGLLTKGSTSVAEVADAVGYGSEAAFSRAFKKLVGVPPATWRDARNEKAPAL